MHRDENVNIYSAIWNQLFRLWSCKKVFTAAQVEGEEVLLRTWNYIVTLPEFDAAIASRQKILSEPFVQSCKFEYIDRSTI